MVLVAGTRRIPAHRLLLCAASDYFAAMFTSDVREATQDEVKMRDVDPEALQLLVHYMYTGGCFLAWLFLDNPNKSTSVMNALLENGY